MTKAELINNSRIIEYLGTQPVIRAFLFGSRAREEATQGSDIDLLLELDETADLFQLAAIKEHLENMLNATVDVVSQNGLSPRLKPYIEKDKILVYERQNQR